MTRMSEWFCDYCNPERKRLPLDEESPPVGYGLTENDSPPMGWWDVPGKGPNDTTGHACVGCVANEEDTSVYEDVIRRRSELTQRILGEAPPPWAAAQPPSQPDRDKITSRPEWPSHTSPFAD